MKLACVEAIQFVMRFEDHEQSDDCNMRQFEKLRLSYHCERVVIRLANVPKWLYDFEIKCFGSTKFKIQVPRITKNMRACGLFRYLNCQPDDN
ncbi:unnamed protein product [Ambrosiozyma monospora]|uniref:Unnamed protein product n=1 Tax=Ambrosiozyma monospora TaxID=43982 RepID=A0A9W7DLF8_AMBMO|nr:unnamed protein product [Ambrosiozyma monospora]